MCSETFNAGGEVRGCCLGCILGMPEISPFVFIAASYQLHRKKLKNVSCEYDRDF